MIIRVGKYLQKDNLIFANTKKKYLFYGLPESLIKEKVLVEEREENSSTGFDLYVVLESLSFFDIFILLFVDHKEIEETS